jgi:hypothetical protein
MAVSTSIESTKGVLDRTAIRPAGITVDRILEGGGVM